MKFKHRSYKAYLFLLLVLAIELYIFINPQVSSYKKIDVHEHVLGLNQTVRLVKVMDMLKIERVVMLDTPSITFGTNTTRFENYDEHMEELFRIKTAYPDRVLILYTFNSSDSGVVQKFESNLKRGADGLKLYNGVIPELGPINSSTMYAAYGVAEKYKVPVIIHVEAMDEEQREEFEHVLKDFPNVKFTCPHFCGVESRLDVLAEMLDKYPNLYIDSGPWQRVGQFAVLEPEKFRQFCIKYQDRITFASDMVLDNQDENWIGKWLKCDIDVLEKRVFFCFNEPGVQLNGLYLPPEVLEKIYETNPQHIFSR